MRMTVMDHQEIHLPQHFTMGKTQHCKIQKPLGVTRISDFQDLSSQQLKLQHSRGLHNYLREEVRDGWIHADASLMIENEIDQSLSFGSVWRFPRVAGLRQSFLFFKPKEARGLFVFSKANKSRFFYSVVALGRFRCLSSPLETLTPNFLKLSVSFFTSLISIILLQSKCSLFCGR